LECQRSVAATSATGGDHVPGESGWNYTTVITYDGDKLQLGGRRNNDNARWYQSIARTGDLDWDVLGKLTLSGNPDGIALWMGIITKLTVHNYDLSNSQVDKLMGTGAFTPSATPPNSSAGSVSLVE